MTSHTRFKLTVALAIAQSVRAASVAAEPSDAARPAVIRNIEQQGLEIMGEFQAPGGLRGFAGVTGNRPIAVYVTPDGEHAIVGALLDSKGTDVSASALERLVVLPMSERIRSQLERSHWVVDGKADAPRVVYAFTDPNCPYCHQFWESSRRWIQSGKVQVRHIMVGVIRPDSANKAAAIVTATFLSPSGAVAHEMVNLMKQSARARR